MSHSRTVFITIFVDFKYHILSHLLIASNFSSENKLLKLKRENIIGSFFLSLHIPKKL